MGSSYCGVFGCTNNSKTTPHLSFFSLPKDDERRKKWVELMDRNDIMNRKNPRQLVCSEHFAKDMLKNKRLKPDAVPSLNLPGSIVLSCRSSSKEHNASLETQVDTPVIVVMVQPLALAQDAGAERASSSTSAQRDAASAGEGTPLNSDDDPEKYDDLHEGFTCNSCSGPISGFRYTCVQCSDYDLCGSCEARGAHPFHYVLRIPKPAPFAEIQCVLSKILTQLLYGAGADTEPERDAQTHDNEPPEVTIKVEIKDELSDPLETEDDVFQADDSCTEANKEHSSPTDQTQHSQLLNVSNSTLTLTETDKALLIIENPVSGSSGAAHTAAAADRTKRRLTHASAEPPPPPPPPPRAHKRARVTRAPAQRVPNPLVEVPITGTVPVTTAPEEATTSAPGGIVTFQHVVVKQEPSFEVFSHSAVPQEQAQARSRRTTGKASAATSRTEKKPAR